MNICAYSPPPKDEFDRRRASDRWLRRALLGVVGSACIAGVVVAQSVEVAKPEHWRVTWKGDATREATVSWSTRQPGKQHTLWIRADDQEKPRPVVCQRNGRHEGSNRRLELHYHHARLQELKPDTKYHLVLDSDGARSPPLHFITAPTVDRPFRILSGGDSRSGTEARRAMNRMIAEMVARQPTILALAHGGDYVYDGRKLDQWTNWLSDHELTVTDNGRLLPLIPARGNHDRGELFNEIFDFPPGDRNFYALAVGSQLRLVTLNTEASIAGDQARWLRAELTAARPRVRWLVAQYHRAAFPAVKWPSGAYLHWVPIFEEANVDLVCEADGHAIKRTQPIRGRAVDPTGVVYIGEGGLGVAPRIPWGPRWYLESPGKVGSGHHVHELEFTSEALVMRTIKLGGEMYDEHMLAPRQH